jgi:hypothetical protein
VPKKQTTETWRDRQAQAAAALRPKRKGILISARLYEELKDYLVMEIDMTASNLLRRLRESNDG